MTKSELVKWAVLAAKIIGGITAADLTAISPKYGVVLFIVASSVKDALNRWAERQESAVPIVTTGNAGATETK